MKHVFFALSLVLLFGCGDSNSTEGNSDELLVSNFMKDTRSLERANYSNPIEAFEEFARETASETMRINEGNLPEFLEIGKSYSSGVIVVGNHTIVKIVDFEKCKESGSWGACMPFGEGYIKRGDLEFKKEYINQIIGRPDDQKRMGYLFK